MHTTAEKTSHTTTPVRTAGAQGTFFRKAEGASFFGAEQDRGQESFFSPASVQARLTVSQPDDPYEREADATAERVMRMEAPPAPRERKEEEPQRSPEEEQEKEKISAAGPQVSRMESGDEVRPRLMRSALPAASSASVPLPAAHGPPHSRGSPGVPAIQRDGRGPPAVTTNFESGLSASKGGGSSMPEGTRTRMESRFGADFSGVRIHTGTEAQGLSSSIQAQAFAHGSDIYFASGKWAPGTASGDRLLAHELTHTIQQGASAPRPAAARSVAPVLQRTPSVQRAAQDRPVPSQLNAAVSLAKGEEGKVNASEPGPDGNRFGWEHLVDYFKTTMGEDKVVPPGGAAVPGAIAETDIRKQRKVSGPQMDNPRKAAGSYSRDAMPSWCGIFVFWALNKGGVPMKKWELGGRNIRLDAAYPPGYVPKAGDIAYRDKHSHFAIVEKADSTTVTSVNGNTSGENNLGAQVQTRDHPLKSWTAFFDPLLMKDGELRSADGPVEAEKEKSLRELRKEVFGVQRTEEAGASERWSGGALSGKEETVQASGDWHVHPDGSLQRAPDTASEEKQDEEGHSEDALQAKLSRKEFTVGDDAPIHPSETIIQREAEEREEDRGPPVILRTGEEQIQGGWFDTALSYANAAYDYAADGLAAGKRLLLGEARDFAMAIPGYRALRVVLGEDPVTSERVDRNGHTFIEAAFDIMPGGRQLHEKLTELGALDEAAAWIDRQIESITGLVNGVVARIVQFWEGIGLDDLASPVTIFEEAGRIIHDTITNVVTFAVTAARELLETVKRWLLTHIVDFIRTRTPAYRLLQVILGQDPVTNERVERNGTNILNALLDLGGEEGAEQRRQMTETGTFARVAGWIDEGIAVFSGAYDEIRAGFSAIWDFVSIDALMNPVDTFNRIWDTFAAPVQRVLEFVGRAARAILGFIKEVLMQRLSAWARGVRGYHLVTVLVGQDPFTGQEVPRTVHNIVRGFMSLMEGGEEQYNQLRESGAIDRVVDRVNAAVARLGMTVEYVINLFTALWNSFSLADLADPVAAFGRILARFGEPIGRLIDFVVSIVRIVVETVLQLMNFPTALIGQIIANAMAAFDRIKRDPVGFLKNLLRAVKQGFIQFFDHIVQHLTSGLVGWLMAELRDAGVPQLTDLSLRGIITWVLQVLNISMEAIWAKLAAHPRIGPERVARIRGMIGRLEGIWTFIKDVQERGMAAIWDKIQEQLSNLWNTILDSVKTWVMERIVNRIVARLLSMLDPTGIMAVINSAIALYRGIQSFVRYIREMLEVVNSFVGGIAEIAGGNIATAANFLERSMGRAMPVVIGFLANQVGLSGIGRDIANLIGIGRELVDRALTWLVDRAVNLGGRLLDMGRGAVGAVRGWIAGLLGLRKPFTTRDGRNHNLYFEQRGAGAGLMVASLPKTLETLISERRTQMQQENTATPAKVPENAPKLAALQQAELLKTQVDGVLPQYNDAVDRASDRQANQHRTTIEQRMNSILEQLIIAGIDVEGSNNIPTQVEHTPGGSGRPLRVVAQPLTTLPGNTAGSTPQEAPLGKNVVAPAVWADYWVAAHLLNHHLHGPGLQWNLVAGTKETNNNMKTEIENTAKDEVSANPTKQYFYEVNVAYYSAQPGKPYMADFPFQINVQFGELQGTPGAFSRGPARGRAFTQDSPDLTNTVMPAFNESSASRLKAASDAAGVSIPASVFEAIVDARREQPGHSLGATAGELVTRMDAYYVANSAWPAGRFTTRYGAHIQTLGANHIFMHY